jgi:SAM-dependent methyltransferase
LVHEIEKEESMSEHQQQVNNLQALFRGYIERRDFAGLFDAMYTSAQEGHSSLPWANMKPNPFLLEWAESTALSGDGKRALVVGCGLGDDAEELVRRGFEVTAFDFSSVALTWCKQRFPASRVQYCAADLLALTERWYGSFDFVLEIFTLQSLPREHLDQAIMKIAATLAEDGVLLVICLGSDVVEPGPIPLPVTPADLAQFQHYGLEVESYEDFVDQKTNWRLFRVVYRRRK